MIAQETVQYSDKLKQSLATTVFVLCSLMFPFGYYFLKFDIITILTLSFIYYGLLANSVHCYRSVSNIAESLSNMECKNMEVIENVRKQMNSISLYNIIGFLIFMMFLLITILHSPKTALDIIIMSSLCTSMLIYMLNAYFAVKLEIQLHFEHFVLTKESNLQKI